MKLECENCGTRGKYIPGSQFSEIHKHHVLFGRDKRFPAFCNRDFNIADVCVTCHGLGGNVNHPSYASAKSLVFKRRHMHRLVAQHGYQVIRDWLDSAPAGKRKGDEWKQANRMLMQLEPA